MKVRELVQLVLLDDVLAEVDLHKLSISRAQGELLGGEQVVQ